MPQEPLLDPTSVDLSKVIVNPEGLQLLLRQRGTFEMLDGVVFEDVERGLIVGFKDIRANDWWAADHIPGRPIFPGALMIEASAQLGSVDYMRNRTGVPEGKFLGFGGVDRARFRGLVEPPCRMIFAAQLKRARPGFFSYDTQGFVEDRLVFEANVIGVVV